MFVYSVKGNTLKLAAIISAAVVLMLSLLILIPRNGEEVAVSNETEKISYNKIKTNDDRVNFLAQFGWQVEPTAIEEVTVKIPKSFDKVLSSYNNIQLHQGLDLTKYAGKEVMRCTYKVTNYPDYAGEVVANLIIYRNRVIGGDICSSDVDGFIHDFTFPGTSNAAGTQPADTSEESAAPDTDALSPDDAGISAEDTSASPDTAPPEA